MVYRRVMEQQLVPFGFYHLLGTIFCIGLDIGVTIAVAVLLYYQVCLSITLLGLLVQKTVNSLTLG